MKTRPQSNIKPARALLCLLLSLLARDVCLAQLVPISTQPPLPGDYSLTQVNPDSCVWQNSSGQTVTSIQTGMNFFNGSVWTPSNPSFVPSPDGTKFVATQIQDPTTISAQLNVQGAISVISPDNVTIRSTPIAISVFDSASGLSALVATLTNSTGVQVDPQDIVFDRALVGGGFQASVVYSRPDVGSFHQDVVFTGFNPNFNPTNWGFAESSTNTLQVQIWTEFYNPPQPLMVTNQIYIEQNPAVRASMASPDLIDYTLDFGDYVFGPGQAYTSAVNGAPSAGIPVIKDFVTDSGRTFLVEKIPFIWLEKQLKALPPIAANTRSPTLHSEAKKTMLAASSLPPLLDLKPAAPSTMARGAHAPRVSRSAPSPTASLNSSKIPIEHSSAALATTTKPHGVVVDYIVTVSSTVTPTLYTSDTTYFVNGNVTCSSPTTMESAVFKFPTNAGCIQINSTLIMTTTNYRPAIFTSADDSTAGASLSSIYTNYTGTPTNNSYGSTSGAILLNTTANVNLNNLRICYMSKSVQINPSTYSQIVSVSHAQLVGGTNGIYINGGSGSYGVTLNINNTLMDNIGCPLNIASSAGVTANFCNCTFDTCADLIDPGTGSNIFNFTNSIFFYVSALGTSGLSGSNNGFYHSSNFGSAQYTNTTSPFQTNGAGYHYLSPTSSFVTNGTTNVGSALLAQLKMKTVMAPLFLTNSITKDTSLIPIAQRDTNGLALGWHYDPIDYFAACSVTNATLFLIDGVALAYYDNLGIWLQDGSQLVSQGTPNYRNYIAYYGQIQEQPVKLWPVTNAVAQSLPIAPTPYGSNANPSIFLRLTTICASTGQTNLLNTADFGKTGQVISSLTLRDCEVYGSGANWLMTESNNTPVVGLTNNVFYRVPFAISNKATITCYNNLFYGTTNTNEFTVSIRYRGTNSPNTNENNVFDGVTASLDGQVGYNAYLHGATNAAFHTNDIQTNLTWLAGPLGAYYQPTNSPLINKGSASASNLDLYHYTVTTNLVNGYEIKETNSIVDLGYHFVAVTSSGIPIATNGQGVPDYLQGTSADGISNSWAMEYFGTLAINTNADYDGTGETLLQDYQQGIDPNVIEFNLTVSNQYVKPFAVPLQTTILAGMPTYMATLVDNTNWADATWIPYTSPPTVSPGTNAGWHTISLGLRGLPTNAQPTWSSVSACLITSPPVLTITNQTPGTVTEPVIQIQGYSSPTLAVVSYTLSNSTGVLTGQPGFVTTALFNNNNLTFTNSAFQCYDVPLSAGTNLVTLQATDLAGNATVTNLTYNLNSALNTNPPAIILTWPQNGALVSGSYFTIRGILSDPYATLAAQIIDNGATNSEIAEVERTGSFLIPNVPMGSGTATIMITATNEEGYGSSTNISVTQSAVALSITGVALDFAQAPTATVSGTAPSGQTVYVNGIEASHSGGSWTASNVPCSMNGNVVLSATASSGGSVTAEAEADVAGPTGLFISSYQYNLSYHSLVGPFYDNATETAVYGQAGNLNSAACQDNAPDGDYTENGQYVWNEYGTGTYTLWQAPICGGELSVVYTNLYYFSMPGPVTNQWVTQPDNYYDWGWTPLLTEDYFDADWYNYDGYSAQAQVQTTVTLVTGGSSASSPESLWEFTLWAVPDFGTATNLPADQMSIAGQPVAEPTGGYAFAYMMLPNNTTMTVTPSLPNNTSYALAGAQYTPQIMANGIPLGGSQPTFCVGQQITFTLGFSPAFPATISNLVCNWILPPNFVNAVTNNSHGCPIYSTNSSLLQTTNPACWYYNAPGGRASVGFSGTLAGKTIRGAAAGTFAIYRPQIVGFSNGPPPIITNYAGYLSLGNGNTGDMQYTATILSDYAGCADITQLINRSATSGKLIDSTSGQYWLDAFQFYLSQTDNPNSVRTLMTDIDWPLLFGDGPEIALSTSTTYPLTTIYDQFQDYVVFRPGSQNSGTNIFVTLGKTTWSWSASSTYSNGTNSPPTGIVTAPSYPDNSSGFPAWPQVHHNN